MVLLNKSAIQFLIFGMEKNILWKFTFHTSHWLLEVDENGLEWWAGVLPVLTIQVLLPGREMICMLRNTTKWFAMVV
jgi:hypothetical protein